MILTDATMAELWYTAAAEEFGLRLVLADPRDVKVMQNALYRVRQELADPKLSQLSLCLPEGGKEIWLVQQTVDLTEEPSND